MDSHENATGPIGELMRLSGVGSIVGVPIIVDGQVWGMAAAAAQAPEVVPPDAEAWIGDFADLLATAIANAVTRDQLRELAEQQAALRRVATLVARGASPSEVFAAVATEMSQCLHVENASVMRYESDDTAVILAVAAVEPTIKVPPEAIGTRVTLEGDNTPVMTLRTGRPARMEGESFQHATGSLAEYLRGMGVCWGVSVPIVVGGRVWGTASAGSRRPMPSGIEARMADFADLVATSIANAATRDELSVLAEQQAALRRVATLVARGVSASEVFAAVVEELAQCLHAGNAGIFRVEGDAMTLISVANLDPQIPQPVVGERLPLEGDNAATEVLRTSRAARMYYPKDATGAVAALIRESGLYSTAAAPIMVDGRVWGMFGVGSYEADPLPADTEERLGDFADLVSTAIANAATRDELIATRDELIASRARIVAAANDARRRIERDLHDGAQQRLVSLGLQLRLAESSLPPEPQSLKELVSGIVSGLTAVSSDLQEISRGIHPAILSEGGLGPALKTLARRCPIPAKVDVLVEGRLPDSVEVAAYYVAAEALTNAAKYADASQVTVCAETKNANLCLSIQDDGIGGADSCKGSGLIGLKDRVEVLGGHMKVISPPGSGTALHVTIPLNG
jgi:signal transduction histidine kinase